MVDRRRTDPDTQRNPSPNGAPAPPPTRFAPWKSSTGVVEGNPDTARENESLATLLNPKPSSAAPVPVEFWQPRAIPAGPALSHGQAAPASSP